MTWYLFLTVFWWLILKSVLHQLDENWWTYLMRGNEVIWDGYNLKKNLIKLTKQENGNLHHLGKFLRLFIIAATGFDFSLGKYENVLRASKVQLWSSRNPSSLHLIPGACKLRMAIGHKPLFSDAHRCAYLQIGAYMRYSRIYAIFAHICHICAYMLYSCLYAIFAHMCANICFRRIFPYRHGYPYCKCLMLLSYQSSQQ